MLDITWTIRPPHENAAMRPVRLVVFPNGWATVFWADGTHDVVSPAAIFSVSGDVEFRSVDEHEES